MWEEARKSLILCGKMAFPVKWGIYFINVFRGRDRQKLPPVKYEKVFCSRLAVLLRFIG